MIAPIRSTDQWTNTFTRLISITSNSFFSFGRRIVFIALGVDPLADLQSLQYDSTTRQRVHVRKSGTGVNLELRRKAGVPDVRKPCKGGLWSGTMVMHENRSLQVAIA